MCAKPQPSRALSRQLGTINAPRGRVIDHRSPSQKSTPRDAQTAAQQIDANMWHGGATWGNNNNDDDEDDDNDDDDVEPVIASKRSHRNLRTETSTPKLARRNLHAKTSKLKSPRYRVGLPT